MKKRTIPVLFLLVSVMLNGQTIDSLWHGYLSPIVQTGGSAPDFTFQGAFNSAGGFNGAQIDLAQGPRLVFFSNNKCYELPITTITGSGSVIAGTATDPSGQLSALPSGTAAIFNRSAGHRVAPLIAGVPDPLQACIQTNSNLKVDSVTIQPQFRANTIVYVSPSATAATGRVGDILNPVVNIKTALDSLALTVTQNDSTHLIVLMPGVHNGSSGIGAPIDGYFKYVKIHFMPGASIPEWDMSYWHGRTANNSIVQLSGAVNYNISGSSSSCVENIDLTANEVDERGDFGTSQSGCQEIFCGKRHFLDYKNYIRKSGQTLYFTQPTAGYVYSKRVVNHHFVNYYAQLDPSTNFLYHGPSLGTVYANSTFRVHVENLYPFGSGAIFIQRHHPSFTPRWVNSDVEFRIDNYRKIATQTTSIYLFELNNVLQIDTGSVYRVTLGAIDHKGGILRGPNRVNNAQMIVSGKSVTAEGSFVDFNGCTFTNAKVLIKCDNFKTTSASAITFTNCTIDANSQIIIEGNFESATNGVSITNTTNGQNIIIRNANFKCATAGVISATSNQKATVIASSANTQTASNIQISGANYIVGGVDYLRRDTQYFVVPIVPGNTAITHAGATTINTGFIRFSSQLAGYKVRNIAYAFQTAGIEVGQSIQLRVEKNGIAQADSEVTLNTTETRKEIATTAAAYTIAAGDLYRVVVQTNTFTSDHPGGLNIELMLVR